VWFCFGFPILLDCGGFGLGLEMNILNMRLTAHAKERLKQRYGLERLPADSPVFVRAMSNTRKLWRIGRVYVVVSNSVKKIITVLSVSQGGVWDRV